MNLDPTEQQFQLLLNAITDDTVIQKAKKIVAELTTTKGSSFKQSVPAQINDTNIILSELIIRYEHLRNTHKAILNKQRQQAKDTLAVAVALCISFDNQ